MKPGSGLCPEFSDGRHLRLRAQPGSGSSRDTELLCLKELGIRVVIARIFYRNCINVGLIALEYAETNQIRKGDLLQVEYQAGVIHNQTTGEAYTCNPLPDHIAAIIELSSRAD